MLISNNNYVLYLLVVFFVIIVSFVIGVVIFISVFDTAFVCEKECCCGFFYSKSGKKREPDFSLSIHIYAENQLTRKWPILLTNYINFYALMWCVCMFFHKWFELEFERE